MTRPRRARSAGSLWARRWPPSHRSSHGAAPRRRRRRRTTAARAGTPHAGPERVGERDREPVAVDAEHEVHFALRTVERVAPRPEIVLRLPERLAVLVCREVEDRAVHTRQGTHLVGARSADRIRWHHVGARRARKPRRLAGFSDRACAVKGMRRLECEAGRRSPKSRSAAPVVRYEALARGHAHGR